MRGRFKYTGSLRNKEFSSLCFTPMYGSGIADEIIRVIWSILGLLIQWQDVVLASWCQQAAVAISILRKQYQLTRPTCSCVRSYLDDGLEKQ